MVASVSASMLRRCVSAQRSAGAYSRALSAMRAECAGEALRLRRMRAHMLGVMVNEMKADSVTARLKTTANSRNKRPMSPPIPSNGMKTASSDTVIETMVKPISFTPRMAASTGRAPESICCTTFSVTTMASSTTNPVEMVSAINDRLSRL